MLNSKVQIILDKYSSISNELTQSITSLAKTATWILTFAHEYDYNESVKANGFRSVVKIIDKFFNILINHQLSSPDTVGYNQSDDIEEFEKIAQSIELFLSFVKRLREHLAMDDNDGLSRVFCTDVNLNQEMIYESTQIKDKLEVFYGRFANFHLCPSLQNILRVYMGAISFCWSGLSITNIFGFLTNHYKHVANTFADFNQNCDVSFFSKMWNLSENPLYTKVAPFLLYGPRKPSIAETKVFVVPRLYSIKANGDIIENTSPTDTTIRTRFLLNSYDSTNDTLILHVHGAGFVAMSPDSHEIYTRGWSAKLDTIPILSVDYSLSPKSRFPKALQELVDIYLHLVSRKNDVLSQIGLHPTRIIFAGDSAGSNLILALTLVLNDISRQFNVYIPLPVAILSIYSPNLLHFFSSPSRMFTAFDVLLPMTLNLEVIGAYVNFDDETTTTTDGKGNCNNNNNGRDDQKDLADIFNRTKQLPWYKTQERSDIFHILANKLQHPYFSPLYYQHFDDLSSVTLHLLTGEYDPFLDENISLAKMWRGKVTLDVVPDMGHGFLSFTGASSEVSAANDLCVRRLCESAKKLY